MDWLKISGELIAARAEIERLQADLAVAVTNFDNLALEFAAERERCVQKCEDIAELYETWGARRQLDVARECAAAIRKGE